MITERAIINALIIGATLILAPFIVSEFLSNDYLPWLVFMAVLLVVLSFFYLKETLCVWPLLGGSIAGSLNFLPLPLKAGQVFCIMLILYYITGFVVIKQRRIKLGLTRFLWPILIVTLIILYHNHSLNIGVLGGDSEGGKSAILIYLVVIAYFCGINVPTPSVKFLSRIPLYAVILTGLSSIPYLLSTYIPALAPLLYRVTDSVNVDTYVDSLSGASDAGVMTSKLAVFAPIGFTLQLYLLCHYPIGTWLRPERWWVIGLSFGCLILQIACGYRSEMFNYALLIMTGAWCYYTWRSLILPATLFIAALIFLVASSNDLIHLPVNKLPMIAQRTLSFLPGDWDPEAIESGKSSNEFRTNIEDVYLKEYADKSPLIGNGFTINTKEFNFYSDAMKGGGWGDKSYLQAKLFIEGKMYHTGWISVYDCVGIIGMAAFIFLGWQEIIFMAHSVFGKRADRRSSLFPLHVWLFCTVVTMLGSYFTVFGSFPDAFMGLLIYGILMSHLHDMENTSEVPIVASERKDQIEPGRLTSAGYGYQSRY